MRAIAAAIAVVALLAGCGHARQNVRGDLPDPRTAVQPELQVVERYVYVPVPAHLTRPEPVAEGSLAECPIVARNRRAALERANARFREIATIQGTEVEP
jgi:hypothetical protein